MDKEEKEMLEALREWVKAEAQNAVFYNERGVTFSESMKADELFEAFCKAAFK